MQEFKAVFDHLDHGQSSTQRLLHLHQGTSSVADFTIQFSILTVGSGWNELVLFHEGLRTEIQLELSCKDTDLDLNICISLAIKLDQPLRGKACRPRNREDGSVVEISHLRRPPNPSASLKEETRAMEEYVAEAH